MDGPKTTTANALLRDAFRHDPSCFVHQGMDCGRCSLPSKLRDIEDEAKAPFIEFAAYVEDKTKPMSYFMSGDTGGHPASEPRSKAMWLKANALISTLGDSEGSVCMCGVGVFDHGPSTVRYCHFGYHTLECLDGDKHVG